MAFGRDGRVSFLHILLLAQVIQVQSENKLPNVKIQVFKPKGFRASIEDNSDIRIFTFDGNVNQDIEETAWGSIHGQVLRAPFFDHRWMVEDAEVGLKLGDVIKYHYSVGFRSKHLFSGILSYNVTVLEDPSPFDPLMPNCRSTSTAVYRGRACSGQTIFEDNFDTLREDVWRIEQYNPIYHPEHPFMTYQRLSEQPTVSTSEGHLIITPQLQHFLPGFTYMSIYNDYLDLFNGCTAPAEACFISPSGYNILPPVVSGRITTKAFAFTYGTVHIRAKLPQGDWLYPELLLEPFFNKYGCQNYASGVIKIASARGNKELTSGSTDYSNRVLYGGPIMDYDCRGIFLKTKVLSDGKQWGDDFHVYSLKWTPDRIILSVDGEEWSRVEPAGSGLQGKIPNTCKNLPRFLLDHGYRIAPFDDYFQLSFGVAAGGTTEFPQTPALPWVNTSPKAQLKFWDSLNEWKSTWTQPELRIDYVKVVAL